MHVPGLLVCVSGVLLALAPLSLCEENHKPSSSSSSSPSSSSSSSSTISTQQQAEDGGEQQCSTCDNMRQHIKTMRLNAIKSQILSKLRLQAAPNISRDVVQQLLPRAPPLQQLLDQYDVLGDQYRGPAGEMRDPSAAAAAAGGMEDEDEEHAFAETIMMMATEPDPEVQVDRVPKCCLFSFRQRLQVSRIVRAQLWIHLRASEEDTTVSLHISRLIPVMTDGRRRILSRFLKIEVKAGVSSWHSIDVNRMLSEWLKEPETNWGIEINAFDERGTDLAVSSTQPGEEGLQPFLEVKISEPGPRRSRRDSGLDCDENSPESRCCRYPLMVDFEDFGWDWIIAPKRYKANYCIGECEYMHLEKYPHTHLVNKATPRGTAGPCCTPKKVSPINMLYFNDKEEIVYGKIPSMVVDRCGCS